MDIGNLMVRFRWRTSANHGDNVIFRGKSFHKRPSGPPCTADNQAMWFLHGMSILIGGISYWDLARNSSTAFTSRTRKMLIALMSPSEGDHGAYIVSDLTNGPCADSWNT